MRSVGSSEPEVNASVANATAKQPACDRCQYFAGHHCARQGVAPGTFCVRCVRSGNRFKDLLRTRRKAILRE